MRFPAALLALLVLSGCTGSSATPPAGTAPTSSHAAAPSASPEAVEVDFTLYQNQYDGEYHFASPTRNILCDIASHSDIAYLSCRIRQRAWQVKDCPGSRGAELSVGEDQAAEVNCAEFPTNGARYRVLPYGHKISDITIDCVSAQEGLMCSDGRTPYGRFFLSRATYKLGVGKG